MAKRRLNERQTKRIADQQKQRRKKATDDGHEDALGPQLLGEIITHHGKKVQVQDDNGAIHNCHFRANLGSLVTGDKVLWQAGEPFGVVVAIMPRQSLLSRPDPYGKIKPIAANIDQVIVVNSVSPPPSAQLIDRYLVAAHAANIRPTLVLNKIDLLSPEEALIIQPMFQRYRDLGYEVCELSALAQTGIEQIRKLCREGTSIIVGQSGVGKSSMINSLLGDDTAKIGALSESSSLGTHTTTTARLYHLDDTDGACGGRIIDSPGIREFGLWNLEDRDIVEGFIELRPLIGQCRFRDCKHSKEPDCAILQAFDEGQVAPERVASFHTLRESIEENAD